MAYFSRSILCMPRLPKHPRLAPRHDNCQILQLLPFLLLPLPHALQNPLQRQKCPTHVDVVRPIPGLRLHFPDRRVSGLVRDAGICAKNIDWAKVSCRKFDAGGDIGLGRYVACNSEEIRRVRGRGEEGGGYGPLVVPGDFAALVWECRLASADVCEAFNVP